ncbi:hypothetical protein MPER_07698, partial [Moniliophthora perniciosa FA553]
TVGSDRVIALSTYEVTGFIMAGVLPSHVPHGETGQRLRLPVAGAEGARLLVDETDGTSNEMFGSEWAKFKSKTSGTQVEHPEDVKVRSVTICTSGFTLLSELMV